MDLGSEVFQKLSKPIFFEGDGLQPVRWERGKIAGFSRRGNTDSSEKPPSGAKAPSTSGFDDVRAKARTLR
jgi:hypothetical protein